MPKCSECGFLTIPSSEGFSEIGEGVRDAWPYVHAKPRCFVRQQQLATEIHDIAPNDGGEFDPWRSTVAIEKVRECSAFRVWEQGFSPKEHVEMGMVQRENERQDRKDRWQLIEFVTVMALAIVGFYFQFKTAQIQADATLKAAQFSVLIQQPISAKAGNGDAEQNSPSESEK